MYLNFFCRPGAWATFIKKRERENCIKSIFLKQAYDQRENIFTFSFQKGQKKSKMNTLRSYSYKIWEMETEELFTQASHSVKKKNWTNRIESMYSDSVAFVNPPAVAPDLPILSCQRANVSHLNHGCRKVSEKILLVACEPMNNGSSGRRSRRVR